MKKTKLMFITFISLFLFIFFGVGCSNYEIKSEKPISPTVKDFKRIHVGWLDLNEDKYKKYYDTREEWSNVIFAANATGLQLRIKRLLKGKKVTGANSKDSKTPKKGMYIKFKLLSFKPGTWNPLTGVIKGIIGLRIQFINMKSKEVLYDVNMTVKSDSGYKEMTLKGRLDTLMAYTAKHICKKIIDKKK